MDNIPQYLTIHIFTKLNVVSCGSSCFCVVLGMVCSACNSVCPLSPSVAAP